MARSENRGVRGGRDGATWKTALLSLPYLGVLYLYAADSAFLLLPGILVCAAVFLLYERIHKGHAWRFPAGWLVSLLMLLPCIYLYVYERLAILLLVAAPALLVFGASLATRGAVGRWWSHQPMFGSLLYLLAVAGLLLGLTGKMGLPPISDDTLFELYSAPQRFRMNHEEMDASLQVVDAAIQGYQRDEGDGVPAEVSALESGLPTALRQDRELDVYVTLWLDRKAMLRGHAAGGRLFEDLNAATDQALDGTLRWRDWVDGRERIRVQVDVVDSVRLVKRRPLHQAVMVVRNAVVAGLRKMGVKLPKRMLKEDLSEMGYVYQLIYEVEPGVDGMILRSGDREGFFLPADPVTRGWLTPRVRSRADKLLRMLHQLSREARGGRDLWKQDGVELYKFRSFCFGRPVPGGETVEFYRGNVLLDGIDEQHLLDGIEEAGRWLLGTVQPDGKFDYEYYPNQDRGSKGYNIVRHAGCVYGLFHMYNLALTEPQLRDDANDYLEAGLRAMDWVYGNLEGPAGAEDDRLYALVDRRDRAESGAAALTLLSLLERPAPEQVNHPVLRDHLQREDDAEVLEGLGLFLLEMIDDRGQVFRRYSERLELDEVEKEPLYFPGETMLALIRFHVATGDERWLEGAKKIGDWQVERYYDRRPNPDHWVMQALWVLYQVTGDDEYAACALHMGDRHASEQFPPYWPPFADYFGAYRRFDDLPRTTRACSRSEAMGGVMHTAWAKGVDATAYEDALLRAAEHLLENQWRPENSYYLPNPDKAQGAIRMGLVDNHCRIDNNQHAVVGLHRALEAQRKRDGVEMPTDEVLPDPPGDEEIRACRLRFGDEVEPLPEEPPEGAPAAADRGGEG